MMDKDELTHWFIDYLRRHHVSYPYAPYLVATIKIDPINDIDAMAEALLEAMKPQPAYSLPDVVVMSTCPGCEGLGTVEARRPNGDIYNPVCSVCVGEREIQTRRPFVDLMRAYEEWHVHEAQL